MPNAFRWFRAALLLWAIPLASCAVSKTHLAELPPYKRLGIVSVAGSELTFKHIGTTAFTNSETTMPVPDWHLDAFIAETMREKLAPKYVVVETHFPAEKLKALDRDLMHSVPAAVRDYVQPKDADAYLVVLRDETGDEITHTNQSLRGLGLLDRTFITLRRQAVFAAFQIFIVDGRTLQVVSHGEGGQYIKTITGPRSSLPYEKLDGAPMSASPEALGPEEARRLKSALERLLAPGIDGALKALHLI